MSTELLKTTYCADAIAFYENTGLIVVVVRLGQVKGLALPGGKQDPDESLSDTISREIDEETGLSFIVQETFGTYADPGRDPRGKYVSTVFVGKARGTLRNEPNKTQVALYDLATFECTKGAFAFDHAKIIQDYLDSRKS